MPRFVANRLAVPAGTIARGTSVPAAASRHRCTIPSPPQTKSSSAPSFERALAPASAPCGSSAPPPTTDRRCLLLRARAAVLRARRRASCPHVQRSQPSAPGSMPLPRCRRVARGPANEHHRGNNVQRRRRRRRRCRSGGACRGTCAQSATKVGIAIATAQIAIWANTNHNPPTQPPGKLHAGSPTTPPNTPPPPPAKKTNPQHPLRMTPTAQPPPTPKPKSRREPRATRTPHRPTRPRRPRTTNPSRKEDPRRTRVARDRPPRPHTPPHEQLGPVMSTPHPYPPPPDNPKRKPGDRTTPLYATTRSPESRSRPSWRLARIVPRHAPPDESPAASSSACPLGARCSFAGPGTRRQRGRGIDAGVPKSRSLRMRARRSAAARRAAACPRRRRASSIRCGRRCRRAARPEQVKRALKDGAELPSSGAATEQCSSAWTRSRDGGARRHRAGRYGEPVRDEPRHPAGHRRAVAIGLRGERRSLDVGRSTASASGVMAGAGFDAAMIHDADGGLKDRLGRVAYVWTGSKNLRRSRSRRRSRWTV